MEIIDINEFKKFVEELAAKHQVGGSVSAEEFNRWTPIYVNDFVSYVYGIPQDYGVERPKYEVTNAVKSAINHLKVQLFLSVPSNGELPKPDDFMYFSTARVPAFEVTSILKEVATHNCGSCNTGAQKQELQRVENIRRFWRPVDLVTDQEATLRFDSEIVAPDHENPIMVQDEMFRLYPADIGYILFKYLRYPKKPFWNNSPNSGTATYLPAGSQHIELPLLCMGILSKYFLQAWGIHNRDEMLIQVAEASKKQA